MATKKRNNETKANVVSASATGVDWEDSTMEPNERTFFKLENGKTRRVHFLSQPARTFRHYVKGIGYWVSRSTFAKTDEGKLYIEKPGFDMEIIGEAPRAAFTAVIAVFDTDKMGNLKSEDPDFEIMLWSFGEKSKNRIRALMLEWKHSEHDLLLTTDNEKFQRLDAAVANNTCMVGETRRCVLAEYKAYPFKDLASQMTDNFADDELRKNLLAWKATKASKGNADDETTK